jgi:hypothetical protein
MGGNDKADALTRTDLERHGQNERLSNFFLSPDNSTGIGAFYDISRSGMHLGELEKRQVWPSGDMPPNPRRSTAKVTLNGRFAIRPRADIIRKQENYCSFLDIYDRVGRSAARQGNCPRVADMDHER